MPFGRRGLAVFPLLAFLLLAQCQPGHSSKENGLSLLALLNDSGAATHEAVHITSPDLSGASSPAETGLLRLFLTDFPLKDKEISKVLVRLRNIEIHSETRGWFPLIDYGPTGRVLDLLSLQNGLNTELGSFRLSPDSYTRIRLNLFSMNSVEISNPDGSTTEEPLTVPSAQHTGIKIVRPIEITREGVTTLILDFDAEKSVSHNRGRGYALKPVIKVKDYRTEDRASREIAADRGGTAEIVGEISVEIPAGALAADTAITITPLGEPTQQPFSSTRIIGKLYDLGPDGTTFSKDITITIAYNKEEITLHGLDESTLSLYYFDSVTGDWVQVPSTVDMAAGTVTGKVDHFTPFGVGGGPPSTIPRINPAAITYATDGTNTSEVPYSVKATIRTKAPATVAYATLFYRKVGTSAFESMPMTDLGGDKYEAILPLSFVRDDLSPDGIEVYIQAINDQSPPQIGCAPLLCSIAPHSYSYNPDLDGDGMNDRWEVEHGLDITVDDSALNPDGDMYTNLQEYQNDTDPFTADVDRTPMVFSYEFGNPGNGDGQYFGDVQNLASDNLGNFYITDRYRDTVMKYDRNGNWVATFGEAGFSGSEPYNFPTNIEVGRYNRIFVQDGVIIKVVDPNTGNLIDTIHVGNVFDFALDSSDNIYAIDTSLEKVMKYSPAGVLLAEWNVSALRHIEVNRWNNRVYVSTYTPDPSDPVFQMFDLNGNYLRGFGKRDCAQGPLQFCNITGFSFVYGPSNNRIFVSDLGSSGGGVVQVLLPDGSFARKMTLNQRNISILLDPQNRVLTYNLDIRKFQVYNRFLAFQFQFGERYGDHPGTFQYPISLLFDSTDNVYIPDNYQRVQKMDYRGNNRATLGGTYGDGPDEFNTPVGTAMDARGNLYVSDIGNRRIKVYDPAGNYLRSIVSADVSNFYDIAIDSTGSIYAPTMRGEVAVLDPITGALIRSFPIYTGISTDMLFVTPSIYIKNDRVYLSTGLVNVIRIFKLDGTHILDIGTPATTHPTRLESSLLIGEFIPAVPGPDGEMNDPGSVAVDEKGYIYVADMKYNRIQKFDSAGNFVTRWGLYGTGPGEFYYPIDLAFAPNGDLFVADYMNSRIQVFTEAR